MVFWPRARLVFCTTTCSVDGRLLLQTAEENNNRLSCAIKCILVATHARGGYGDNAGHRPVQYPFRHHRSLRSWLITIRNYRGGHLPPKTHHSLPRGLVDGQELPFVTNSMSVTIQMLLFVTIVAGDRNKRHQQGKSLPKKALKILLVSPSLQLFYAIEYEDYTIRHDNFPRVSSTPLSERRKCIVHL